MRIVDGPYCTYMIWNPSGNIVKICNGLPRMTDSGSFLQLSCSSSWASPWRAGCETQKKKQICKGDLSSPLPARLSLFHTPAGSAHLGLYTASVVSLKDALIGWSASDYDASIQLWRIKINTGYTLPSPTWRASPTWRKQNAFPLPGTAALWVFWKSREFPAFFRGRGQSYARRHGTWNSLGSTGLYFWRNGARRCYWQRFKGFRM